MNWINATLLNDETSSDDELRSYFMTEGKMSLAEADYYVRQRDAALKDMYYHAKPYRGTYFEINPAYAGKTGAEISKMSKSHGPLWIKKEEHHPLYGNYLKRGESEFDSQSGLWIAKDHQRNVKTFKKKDDADSFAYRYHDEYVEQFSHHPKELLHGGKGDNRPDRAFDPVQLRAGMRVEREHTTSKAAQKEISKDHLTEDKDYYKKLAVMEHSKRFKKNWRRCQHG